MRKDDLDFKASLFGNRTVSKTALSPKLSQSKAVVVKPGDVMCLILIISLRNSFDLIFALFLCRFFSHTRLLLTISTGTNLHWLLVGSPIVETGFFLLKLIVSSFFLYSLQSVFFLCFLCQKSSFSCFANVVLQCLSWTRPLVAYLLERGHKRECKFL